MMNVAPVINSSEVGFSLSGSVTVESIVDLRRQGERCIDALPEPQVDFQQVANVDSSVLALMLAWLRYAKRHHKQLQFHHVPSSLYDVAVVCGVEEILGLSAAHG